MSQQEKNQKIKELRNRTQAGIVDCKKALEASSYDLEAAIEWLKEQGIAKAIKKGGAIAAEGVVAIHENSDTVVMYEINSQTDFASTNENFQKLVAKVGKVLLNGEFNIIEQALELTDSEGLSVYDMIAQASAVIGEKIVLRRALRVIKVEDEVIGTYVHNNQRIASIIIIVGGNAQIARYVAMHVASMNPDYLNQASVPEAKIDEMKNEIYSLLVDKPEKLRDNIAVGMLNKKLAEITLVDQEFIMEKIKVKDYLAKNGAKVIAMYRYELAEGITKKSADFAAEVAAQMGNHNEN